MSRSARQRLLEPVRPLTRRAIGLGSVLLIVVGAVAFAALLYFYGGGTDLDRAKLDVVRTAGTLAAVPGGSIALFLAARRQRSTELTLEHQREVAVEQRITELYTRAVDQLGNDQAPVRLGGLHALERLAQNNPAQRQTIVDVICAYLRMPYALPDDKPPGEDAPAEAHTRYEQRRQELQVRLTAQRIVAAHLRPDTWGTFWPDIDLDLTEAQLHQLDLTDCRIRNAEFGGAKFSGDAAFDKANFSGNARFDKAKFSGGASFSEAQFSGDARFYKTKFSGNAGVNKAKFSAKAVFGEAKFSGNAWFDEAEFSGDAEFNGAQYSAYAVFGGAQFSAYAWFDEAQFFGDAVFGEAPFGGAQFSGNTRLAGARTRPAEDGFCSWPTTWSTREACEGEEDGWLYLVRVEE